jgi:hypothetical protein
MDSVEFALPRPRETSTTEYSPFSTWRFFSREQVKSECDWVVMSSVFVASQSSCFFLCSREQIRLVENRLKKTIAQYFPLNGNSPLSLFSTHRKSQLASSQRVLSNIVIG